MKAIQLRWRRCLPALLLILLSVTTLDGGTAMARAPTGVPAVVHSAPPPCSANGPLHAATHQYRMFYDQRYLAAQRVSAATSEYRWFYEYRYASAQRIAAATDRYCAGHR